MAKGTSTKKSLSKSNKGLKLVDSGHFHSGRLCAYTEVLCHDATLLVNVLSAIAKEIVLEQDFAHQPKQHQFSMHIRDAFMRAKHVCETAHFRHAGCLFRTEAPRKLCNRIRRCCEKLREVLVFAAPSVAGPIPNFKDGLKSHQPGLEKVAKDLEAGIFNCEIWLTKFCQNNHD